MTKCPAIALDAKHSVLFISDIHLHEQKPELTSLFLKFLNEKALSAQALFILGDLFDVWLGDDIATPFDHDIAATLRNLKQNGTPIYFMPGNRDFLLSKSYCEIAGLTLLTDPYLLNFGDKKILLTHGDLLCTDDKIYQFYRIIAQHPITKYFFSKFSKSYRNHIAQKLRQNSKRYQKQQPMAKLDATDMGVKKMIKKTVAQVLIHGHVHRANHFKHVLGNRTVDRYVLGTWHKTGSYIELHKDSVSIKCFEN